MQLTGLLGLTDCITDNLDNPDAHDYGSGSVAHFGKDGGLGGCMVCWPKTAHFGRPSKIDFKITLFMDPIEQDIEYIEYIH